MSVQYYKQCPRWKRKGSGMVLAKQVKEKEKERHREERERNRTTFDSLQISNIT
jgi:hypothetical protein